MSRSYTTYYYVGLTTLDVEYYLDLEIGVRGHSVSLKSVPFESLDAVSYSPSIVTGRICSRFVIYLASKTGVTLKTGLNFVQDH